MSHSTKAKNQRITNQPIEETLDTVLGLEISKLANIKRKLDALGINLDDLAEFLDRDKVQLFAEIKNDNRILLRKIEKVKAELDC